MSLKDNTFNFVERVTYKQGYSFVVDEDESGVYVQVRCWRPDTYTGNYGYGYGGKGRVTEETTHAQLNRMLFGLIKAYEEHETREFYKVDGVPVFGPHISLNALLEAGTHLEHLED